VNDRARAPAFPHNRRSPPDIWPYTSDRQIWTLALSRTPDSNLLIVLDRFKNTLKVISRANLDQLHSLTRRREAGQSATRALLWSKVSNNWSSIAGYVEFLGLDLAHLGIVVSRLGGPQASRTLRGKRESPPWSRLKPRN
jgi:hypothetical protein